MLLKAAIMTTGENKTRLPERAGHSSTELPDGRMLIFGGLDFNGKFHNDAFILDARRLAWFKLTGAIRGAPPKPRAYHSCAHPPPWFA